MRILGKGKTAQAIKELYTEVKMYDDQDFEGFEPQSEEETIVSPGIPPFNSLVQKTKNQISDYDFFLDESKYTIWISGTNGKTTTTSMVNLLLEDDGFKCGGNIGEPLANIYKNDKLILETSSFTLHYTNKVSPNIYVLLPITADHIYWHGTFSEYENSKLKPLKLMNENDIAIIPSKYKSIDTKAKVYFYEDTFSLAKQFNIDISKINFKEPFLQDAILALIVEKLYKGSIDYQKINSFVQDAHKLEEFKDKNGNLWIDDSKATNIDATIQALKTYKDSKMILILGGDDKGADLNPLFKEMQKYDLSIVSIGKNSELLKNLALKYDIECIKMETIEQAVKKIVELLNSSKKGHLSMLSPAAASLDQFSSYKDRGTKFKEFVKLFSS